MATGSEILLTQQQHSDLSSVAQSRSLPAGYVFRAKLILMLAMIRVSDLASECPHRQAHHFRSAANRTGSMLSCHANRVRIPDKEHGYVVSLWRADEIETYQANPIPLLQLQAHDRV